MQNGFCESFSGRIGDELLNETLFHGKRCVRPTHMMGFPAAAFQRALRFGLEQSVGTNGATFVGFGWEQHKPA